MFNKYYTKMKRSTFYWIFLIIVISSSCRNEQAKSPYTIVQSLISDSCMVVAEHPLAAKVGVEILHSGGNAVDVAIATQFALAVVYPRAGNIGGGGFMVIRLANGESAALDYREQAPAASFRDMYLDSTGVVIDSISKVGHLSVGIPGTVAGMEEAFMRYSKLKNWQQLLAPAIMLAEKGFEITSAEASRLNNYKEQFQKHNENAAPFVKNDIWEMGDVLVQKDLGSTLRHISKDGSKGFYDGKTADLIVEEMKRGDGIITLEDLKSYKAIWRQPIITQHKGYTIITMPPSSSGGIALSQILGIIEPYPIKEYGFHSAKAVHLIVEAERRVYADRSKYLGDSDYFPVPVDSLLDENYLSLRMSNFDENNATDSGSLDSVKFKQVESFETTHTSIVDKEGNAVSVTTTLNLNYGSKVIVAGAGFFLNDEMDDFSAKPGVPNYFGLVGAEANAIQPRKRMLSSMTPTIITKNGQLFMVLGAPGGSTIITAVLQTILNVIEYDMPLDKAVAAPRFHHQWLPDQISVEPTAIDTIERKKLWDMGHKLQGVSRMALVKAVQVLPDGRLHGAGDPRNEDDHAEGY